MTREEKLNIIDYLKTKLAESNNIYLTDASGLNAETTSKLRRECFKSNIKLEVVKNTLLLKAMESSEIDFGDLPSVLTGNTAMMFSQSGNAPAKLIKEFRFDVEPEMIMWREDFLKLEESINKIFALQKTENFLNQQDLCF